MLGGQLWDIFCLSLCLPQILNRSNGAVCLSSMPVQGESILARTGWETQQKMTRGKVVVCFEHVIQNKKKTARCVPGRGFCPVFPKYPWGKEFSDTGRCKSPAQRRVTLLCPTSQWPTMPLYRMWGQVLPFHWGQCACYKCLQNKSFVDTGLCHNIGNRVGG